jgi:hypothetical protein
MPKKPYEKPAVIYQDVVKTRAGSPIVPGGSSGNPQAADPFDPAQIFD